MFVDTVPSELLDKWRKWSFQSLSPRELPVLCRMKGLCPPGFRSPDKVPYPLLKTYFDRNIAPNNNDAQSFIISLRKEYPKLEHSLESLPVPCSEEDLSAIDEIENSDLVLGLLFTGREDLTLLAEQLMQDAAPFDIPDTEAASPSPVDSHAKENKRLARLLDDMKKESLKKETKWQKEMLKLRHKVQSAESSIAAERKAYREQLSLLQGKFNDERNLHKESERLIKLQKSTNSRLQDQFQQLREQNVLLQTHKDELLSENRALLERISALEVEVRKLQRVQSPVQAQTYSGVKKSDYAMVPEVSFVSDSTMEEELLASPPFYPSVINGILQIPVRSRFGYLTTEQGLDLFISEKIIYNLGAEDGDELEGQLIGEFSPGLPQYYYRLLQKGAEPTSHRELLGTVEERSGWIGVRDLYDEDLFIPLHAYELSNVDIGDVVTVLFDITHPHNNRILAVHEHMLPDDEKARSARRRLSKRNTAGQDDRDSGKIDPYLTGFHVLICGAQSNMVSQYEQAISARGGTVVVLESQPATMEPHVSKADVIICNTHQINHPFFWVVKEEAAKQNKPLGYPISGGVTSMLREVEKQLQIPV